MTALLEVTGLRVGDRIGPVDLTVDAGELAVLAGRSGTGRSAVLLAACGRLRGARGTGRFGHADLFGDARAVRRRTAVARIGDLVDLEPRLTVDESTTERALTEGVPARQAERAVRTAAEAFETGFPARTLIQDLDPLDRALLTAALALVRPAELIVFDDVDRDLDPLDQARLYAALGAVAATGTAVLASTTDAAAVPTGVAVRTLPDPTRPQD